MEAKSKRRALVGYEDGSRSVKYYNAETRSVLTSRNYCFLEPSETVPEQLLVTPDDVAREGELGTRNAVDARNTANAEPGPSNPRKRSAEDDDERRQTRGKRVDYKHLDDPYSDDETMSAEELTNLLEGDEDQPTFEQAKRSLEWPEWEKAIQAELAQLRAKGTWKMVEKPKNAIPISNKWVLTKKRDKEGRIVKYKARLVARSFTQRPGRDYNETFSPVVRFETIRALLAMVPGKKLKV
jgi:hypothetical protein